MKKKIDWNRINNVTTLISIIWLIYIAGSYFAALVIDGLKTTFVNARLEGGLTFWTMLAIVIVVINCCGRMAIQQLKKSNKKTKKESNKEKEVTTKKTQNKTSNTTK